jgi:hypothetical protein
LWAAGRPKTRNRLPGAALRASRPPSRAWNGRPGSIYRAKSAPSGYNVLLTPADHLPTKGGTVARQNYSQGKRQREIARKQKQDRKLQRRQEKKNPPSASAPGTEPEPVVTPPETGS